METNPELGTRLHGLSRALRLIRQRHGGTRSTVPMATFGLLLQIDQLAGDCHARELAAHAGLDPSTVSRGVASLAAHGLIERRPDPDDGRASVLALTAAGRAALAETWNWYGQVLDRALADWSPAEVSAFSSLLGRFTDDIENALGHHDTLEAAR
jgi:DNA-binding MarR family transcriptional regulator